MVTLKHLFADGFFIVLLAGLLAGLVLVVRQRTARSGRIWLSLLLAGTWAASTPAIAEPVMAWWGGGFAPIARAGDAPGASAIVVLTAGARRYRARGQEVGILTKAAALRVLEAGRVYRLLDEPWVIVTGGAITGGADSASEAELMRDQLVALGVPDDRILLEEQSHNTHEHALYVPALLNAHGVERFVLVTSLAHMGRSMRVFAAAGMNPVPSPAQDRGDPLPGDPSWRDYLPSQAALDASWDVPYELAALSYYWVRGWL